MANTKAYIGRGTRVFVAPVYESGVIPPTFSFVVGTGGAAAAATSIPIATTGLTDTIRAPFYITFTDATGKEYPATATADVDPGDTAVTVSPLAKAVPAAATADFPVILRGRTNANLTDADSQADINTFDSNGWRDRIVTLLGNNLEVGGHYHPLDAGWQTCFQARLNRNEVFARLILPAPDGFTIGHTFELFGDVTMPIETPADGIIMSNITITSHGEVIVTEPVV